MKKSLKMLVVLMAILCTATSALAEFDDMEDMDYWYEQVCILSDEIGVRSVGTEGELLAQEFVRAEFERLGFSAENGTLNEYPVSNTQAENLEAILPAEADADILIVCAHYDAATPDRPEYEDEVVMGTRDNASGVAAMLAMAREFTAMPAVPAEIRFVAFTSEETGHQGSLEYAALLTDEVRERIIGVFNLDTITVDAWALDHVFSVDTLGMRTEDGYVRGTEEQPAYNKVARALIAAMEELAYFDPEENGVTHCVPRTLDASDHESFHLAGIDAANIAFRGNVEQGGDWHEYLHTGNDTLGELDYERTYQALSIVYTALEHLALDPSYGD